MIPLRLKLSGFLSYRDPVEVDFTSFDLACISGQNGAGKSSLLDAITWSLFGQARKRDETLINSACDSAEVSFVFEYEQNTYRVQRNLTRGKSSLLEFQINDSGRWRPLTEATLTATQARIKTILRLDYETFVNASFFLQGKADLFTQQGPTERKRILANILGLDVWEIYREQTAERRKTLESELASLEGRLSEINAELAEEPLRKAKLKEFEAELARLAETRKAHEQIVTGAKQALESLKRQQELVNKLDEQAARAENELVTLDKRRSGRESERSLHQEIVSKEPTIKAAYQAWLSARAELERFDSLAANFREQEKGRQEPLARIAAEQARLEQERDGLLRREAEITAQRNQLAQFEAELVQARQALKGLETQLKRRANLEESRAIIARFREQARLRLAPLTEISSEQARLEQELKTLEKQAESVETQRTGLIRLRLELEESQALLDKADNQLQARKELETQVQNKKTELQVIRNNNDRLEAEMAELRDRIRKLKVTDGALCPLCGQPLSAQDRDRLIESLKNEGVGKADVQKQGLIRVNELTEEIKNQDKELAGFGRVEKDQKFHIASVTQINERLQTNQQAVSDWDAVGGQRLGKLRITLNEGSFSLPARQNLTRIDRELGAIGKSLGVRATQGTTIFDTVEEKVLEIENELNGLTGLEEERVKLSSRSAQLSAQMDSLRASIEEWTSTGSIRLIALNEALASGNFALEERSLLAGVDAHLKTLGYDPAAHEAVRRAEMQGRASEAGLRELEAARAALLPLERELDDLRTQAANLQNETDQLRASRQAEADILKELRDSTPDMLALEANLLDAKERENILMRDVGAAQQKVKVLDDQRQRKAAIEAQREDLAHQIKNHKTLERAFSKDGVPALLIEQALPQIEEKANELLDRLSNGAMSVRFVTQAGYKNKKRDDLKETLDIQISDGAGTRDYEMFSGGEAFRVNFAIRLALSEILARRTGARLQTLVIDEGFGSQDALGIQRLIEAINQVKPDFAKILIITHLDELKEAFPNRIEVEKTPRGSSVLVI